MRRISEMYQRSGGTDFRHTCYECKNCRQQMKDKRMIHICRLYGPLTEWKPSYIACKFYNMEPKEKIESAEGQMSIFDFMGG